MTSKEYLTNGHILLKYFELVFLQLQLVKISCKLITIWLSYKKNKKGAFLWNTLYICAEYSVGHDNPWSAGKHSVYQSIGPAWVHNNPLQGTSHGAGCSRWSRSYPTYSAGRRTLRQLECITWGSASTSVQVSHIHVGRMKVRVHCCPSGSNEWFWYTCTLAWHSSNGIWFCCPFAISPHGWFAPQFFHLLAFSLHGWFDPCAWLIHPLACLPLGWFAPSP